MDKWKKLLQKSGITSNSQKWQSAQKWQAAQKWQSAN